MKKEPEKLAGDPRLIADLMRSPEWIARWEHHNRVRLARGLEVRTFGEFIEFVEESGEAAFLKFNAKRQEDGLPPMGHKEYSHHMYTLWQPLIAWFSEPTGRLQ